MRKEVIRLLRNGALVMASPPQFMALAAAMLVSFPAISSGKIKTFTLLEKTREANLIVHAEYISVSDEKYAITNSYILTEVKYFPCFALYKSEDIWKGTIPNDVVTVNYQAVNSLYAPFICRPAVQPDPGEEVVLFLSWKETKETFLLLHGFQGKVPVSTKTECSNYKADVLALMAYDALDHDAGAEQLVQMISTGSQEVRGSMLREMYNLDMSKYGILLTPLLAHEIPEVRIRVAGVLGKRGNEACVPALIDALQDEDPVVRRAVAEALWRQEHPNIDEALMKFVSDESPAVRSQVLFSLSHRNCTAAIPAYYAGLKDPDPLVRRGAVYAFERVACPEAAPKLLKCLEDPDPKVREAVIRVLYVYTRCYRIEPDAALATAMEHCLNDGHVRVRSGAAHFFFEWGITCGPEKIQNRERIELRLLEMMQRADRDNELICIAQALQIVGSLNAQPSLFKLLPHEDWGVRQSASCALGEIGDAAALPKLKAQLDLEEFDSTRNCLKRAIKRLQARIAVQ